MSLAPARFRKNIPRALGRQVGANSAGKQKTRTKFTLRKGGPDQCRQNKTMGEEVPRMVCCAWKEDLPASQSFLFRNLLFDLKPLSHCFRSYFSVARSGILSSPRALQAMQGTAIKALRCNGRYGRPPGPARGKRAGNEWGTLGKDKEGIQLNGAAMDLRRENLTGEETSQKLVKKNNKRPCDLNTNRSPLNGNKIRHI